MDGTDFGYSVFIIANQKFADKLVSALIKLHVLGPCVGKSDGRLKKYHATAGLILCCLRWHSKSFLFNALYGVIHYNDVISAVGLYMFWRNIRFISVLMLKKILA